MIQRTTLPNLANQTLYQKSNSYVQQINKSQIDYSFKKLHRNSQRYTTLNKGLNMYNNLKTQVSLNSQYQTLQMKQLKNHSTYQTKVKSLRQKSIEQSTIASYFFKVHNGLKILQNTEDLKRKLTQAKKQQTQRLRIASIQHSKKKLQKKLITNSKNGTQSVDNFLDKKFRHTLKESSEIQNNKQKNKTQSSQLTSLSSTLKNRKKELTEKAKEAQYSFEHFNSGEIFTQIALINQKKLLINQNNISYQVTQNGTYSNKMYSLGDKRRKKMKKLLEQQFRDEYNAFLRKKLPPSFGQNGNKSCIYQQYVLKRKQQQRKKIKSKLVQGKFLRTQPTLPQKEQFIFTNQINAISAKKMQMDSAFVDKLKQQQSKVKRYITEDEKLKPEHSASTSKIVTKTNTKLNTLRQGQSFINKLKLKKLAKMQEKQKAKSFHKNRKWKSRAKSHYQHSSFSNYENTLSQTQINKFLQKSNLILGKHQVPALSNPQVLLNKQLDNQMNNGKIQLNQFQQQHLSNIDKLLCKEQSILRTQKQDLDCLPWRIAIKIQKRTDI